MARDMFDSVRDPGVCVGTRKWYTVPASALAHAAALAILVVAPLMAAGALPTPQSVLAFASSVPPPPAPPPPPVVAEPAATAPDVAPVSRDTAPTVAPAQLSNEPPPAIATRSVTMAALTPSGPAVTMKEPPPAPTSPLPVGGDIKPPIRIVKVDPDYPMLAKQARIQGIVTVEAVIGRDGRVKNVRVLRSIPALDQAAVDAVSRWVYSPTLLGGRPVEVVLTVTVNFSLR